MKTFLRFLLAACLVLGLGTVSLAAVHSFQQGYFGDFFPTGEAGPIEVEFSILTPADRTFTLEDQDQGFKAKGSFGINGADLTLVNLEYYQNDFVFGDLMYFGVTGNVYDLRGGYLWEDLGLFVGLDYFTGEGDSDYIASGGYRFDLGDGNYAALSLDYYGGGYDGFCIFEAHTKYRTDGMKLTGQLDVEDDGDYRLHGKASFAAGDDLVWGGGFTWFNSDFYMVFAGLTWESGGFLFDGLVNVFDEGDLLYLLSGMYSFSDSLAAGVGYYGKKGSDDMISLKGKYLMDEGTLDFSYAMPTNGSGRGYLGLGYEMSF